MEKQNLSYTGADLIADFIAEKCCGKAFLVTGGACAFIVDAIGRNPKTSFICFQHEQAAAMAADAVWRTTGKIGVTVATSGPGATNLITGIACSWFDSIPSIHITGQVNKNESREVIQAKVRQAGFQETDIVSMVETITKFSKKIEDINDLVTTLPRLVAIATNGRMGPVLIDVPMNVQKEQVSIEQKNSVLGGFESDKTYSNSNIINIKEIIDIAERPAIIIGAGAALSGTAKIIQAWCEKNSLPYVSTWGALSYLDRSAQNYYGSIGVYGSRRANWLIQSADEIIAFGSRLDNRQRTSNPFGFAPFAKITVLDIDPEELKKYKRHSNYKSYVFDLRDVEEILLAVKSHNTWAKFVETVTTLMPDGFENAVNSGEFSPYLAVSKAQEKFENRAVVVSDCGANLCWVFQSYQADTTFLFTAGGNSPMGYSLPAAIGAQLVNPDRKVYCFIGDGGLQMNIQELQTMVHYDLPITIFVQNNFGYGIIKQFQDANFDSRYFATGEGYSIPNFEAIAKAYEIPYIKVTSEIELIQLKIPDHFSIIDLHLPPNALITPKTEMDRFIHDQFPYIKDSSISKLPYRYPDRPSQLRK